MQCPTILIIFRNCACALCARCKDMQRLFVNYFAIVSQFFYKDMATFKPIVRQYRRADGTYRVYIRVTHNRQHRDLPSPFYVTPDQITRGFKIKDEAINDKLEQEVRKYRNTCVELGFIISGIDVDHLISLLHSRSDEIDFFGVWERQLEDMRKNGQPESAGIFGIALNSLRKFNDCKPLYFSNITQEYMLRYFNSIKHLANNTQVMYIGAIKTAYTKAQKELNDDTNNIIIARYGVFDRIELPRKTRSKNNVFKKVEELQAIIDCPYHEHWSYIFAKDMYFLCFTCFGTNMADFIRMKKTQYKDGILTYNRKKTERNSGDESEMQVKVPEVAKIILDKYSGDPKYLIDFQGHARNQRFTRFIHYYFQKAGFEKETTLDMMGLHRGNFTFYSNRHSMASFSRNVCGVEYMTVHEMLNHATPSNFKTTDAYLWKSYEPLWEANDRLLSLFDWSFYLKQKKEAV